VAFFLQFDEKTVVPYLVNLPISREARVMLATFLNELRVVAETYINEAERRLAPGSDCFWVDFVYRDPASRVIHQLRLVISDAAAQYGVLRIVYAEDVAAT
jgi:hypothetical protein